MFTRRSDRQTRSCALLLASVVFVASGLARADELVKCGPSSELETNVGPRGKAAFCVDAEGALNGPAREWYPNGVQRTSDHWKHGVKVGVWIVWDEAGRKREERSFVDGKLHGDETLWHANGKRRVMTTYRLGIRHGPVFQWDEFGELLVSGQFKDDREDGTWIFRDRESGSLFGVVYRDGVEIDSVPSASRSSIANSLVP